MIKSKRALVGVVTDTATIYGRGILRGITRYANLQRRWVLHEDLWCATIALKRFPQCDGAIVAGVPGETFEFIRDHCDHTIYCTAGAAAYNAPMVTLDDKATGRVAATHLLDCHLQHFGFYGLMPNRVVADMRRDGFAEVLQARGYSCLDCPVDWPAGMNWLTHDHHPRLIEWLKSLPKPIGILAVDDMAAHDLAGTCLEADIAVPDEIAIVGVNNDDLLCEGAWPPLSSVDADYTRVGYHAAKMLDRLLAGEELSDEDRCIRLPPLGVVQRMSTSVLAVDDPYLASAIRFIREHACDPCNVQDVLRHVPVNRRWLERQFTQQLGRTPHDEIQRVRIDIARRLLLQPDLTIPNIAYRCGFAAVQTFNKAFRAVTGNSPAAYRRTVLHDRARHGQHRR